MITTTEPLVQSNTEFAIDLYQHLKSSGGNLLFSPYSISSALAMTYAGSRAETAAQMAAVLHFDLDQEQLHPAFAVLAATLNKLQAGGGIELAVANSLWPHIRYPLLEEYLTRIETYYGAKITPLDFGIEATARKTINAWAAAKTQEKIKTLIDPGLIGKDTLLVLTNALYFKGRWARPFNPNQTQNQSFWISPEKSTSIPMMTQELDAEYAETGDLQILQMPYQGKAQSLVVLLPQQSDGLAKLEKALTVDSLRQWIGQTSRRKVRVYLPRFKLESAFKLNDPLKALGMGAAFDPAAANFAGMDGIGMLYIAIVLHKTFMEVNEEGTEAAAATAVMMKPRGIEMPLPPVLFRADHPFIFLIRDQLTGSIFFLGKYSNPDLVTR